MSQHQPQPTLTRQNSTPSIASIASPTPHYLAFSAAANAWTTRYKAAYPRPPEPASSPPSPHKAAMLAEYNALARQYLIAELARCTQYALPVLTQHARVPQAMHERAQEALYKWCLERERARVEEVARERRSKRELLEGVRKIEEKRLREGRGDITVAWVEGIGVASGGGKEEEEEEGETEEEEEERKEKEKELLGSLEMAL